MLSDKNILLGVTGGIAAYKAAFLVRLFIKAGAHVKVIMTSAATGFITPLTLSVLSKNPVLIDFTSKGKRSRQNQGEWNNHVELGRWADLMLIAPATANTLSKMANGICDNLLLAAYLSDCSNEKERVLTTAISLLGAVGFFFARITTSCRF
ncbi:MAG: hypothetical protein JKX84_07690 [Flavobacteriales bacterium]|nr:hypothetical protein [Flavobacteriales bacterium]